MKKSVLAIVIVLLLAACSKNNEAKIHCVVTERTGEIIWKGSAPDHFHTGFLDLKGDFYINEAGKISSGEFTIPLSSITNYDLPDSLKDQLVTHLKGPDFFNILVHPNASFSISKVEAYNGTEGIPDANYRVTGQFSLIGQTHEISFPAKVRTTADSVFIQAKVTFDRLKWGMTSYNDPSKTLYILPEINADLYIGGGKER
ncbi:MAG: YceI family protein [Chitinophagaceae bacterium]